VDEARAVVEEVTSTVSYLRVAVETVDSGPTWLACEPIVREPAALLDLVRSTAAGRGTDRDDVAMSLFVQGYAFRIASVAIGSWLVADRVLDVDAATTSIALGRDRPNAVLLQEPRCLDATDAVRTLHEAMVDGHLGVLVATAHDACRVGAPLLWANVAASCAAAFGAFMDPLSDRRLEIRDRLGAFMAAARPELQSGGEVVAIGTGWAWQRRACCLWYQTESAFKCDDCSLWSDDERRARVDRILAEQEQPA
jgi:ferric iron reductase protein FhuF